MQSYRFKHVNGFRAFPALNKYGMSCKTNSPLRSRVYGSGHNPRSASSKMFQCGNKDDLKYARDELRRAIKRKMNQHLAKGGKKPAGSQAPVDDVMSANHDASSGPGLDLDEPSVTECSGPSLEYRGNPCILFRTKRLLTQKKLIAMHRARDRKELIALKRKIREASELVDQLKKGLHEDS